MTETLGLNIIVGAGEHVELRRCLESCKGDLFDEIVITVTSDDEVVKAVAQEYADKVPYFKWCDHFSNARNYSFSQSTTDKVLWLDADDVIKPENYEKLLKLKKEELHKYEIILIDYVYNHDSNDKPVMVLPRERIVKRCDYLKWHDPIHEYINMDIDRSKIKRFDIKIDHYRVRPFNPRRNLDLLEKEYNSGNPSVRIKFYYGKELCDSGEWDKAVPVLEDYINKADGFRDNLVVACIRMSKWYFDKKEYDTAKSYAMKGVRFNSIYAENYVTLGTIAELNKEYDNAIAYYKEAMTKDLQGAMSQIVDFYGFIPSAKLALLYLHLKQHSNALIYCEKALGYKPENPQMREMKKKIKNEISNLTRNGILDNGIIEEVKKLFSNHNMKIFIEENNDSLSRILISKKAELDIVWMVPVAGQFDPAIRLRRLNIDEKLRSRGIKSRVISSYHGRDIHELRKEIGSANVVVFSQFGDYDLKLMKLLKSDGIKLIRDHCEGMFGYASEAECFNEADVVTCCSTNLERMTKANGFQHTHVIRDAIEERFPKKPMEYSDRYEKPKAVFMGGGGNGFLVSDVLKPVIDRAGYELVLMTEWDNADIKWDINTWPDDFCSCDVSLCPQRVDIQPAKSNVKVTTAMGLGMPVICSPLESYAEVIEQGKNGYICETEDQWYDALMALKDPAKRKEIGEAGKKSVDKYTLDYITDEWVSLFEDLVSDTFKYEEEVHKDQSKAPSAVQVDIIIPNYNNVEYLRLCLSSIMLKTNSLYHIIVSDAGSDKETWEYLRTLKGVTVLGSSDKRLNFSEACNAGIRASSSKYFVIINSDIIVSMGWLNNLIEKMESVPRLAACGVLSNCDRGWLHNRPNDPNSPKYPMKLEKSGLELIPGMKYDTIKPRMEELYEFMDKSNVEHKGVFTKQSWVAAYATIFARCAIDEIGLFDPLYKNGCEDLDLMVRLSSFGYVIGQAIDSFVFHFGGISRNAYQQEDRESYDKEDISNHLKMFNKWLYRSELPEDTKMVDLYKPGAPQILSSKDRVERVAIWTGPAWEPWDRAKVDQGMAGSETWASYLAREFVKKGYRTTVYNDLLTDDKTKEVLDPVEDKSGMVVGNVRYLDHTQMQEDTRYDIVNHFISSRSVAPLQMNLHSMKNYVMIHDVWISGDPNLDVMSWRVDNYAYLSDWHKDFLLGHHKQMPSEKMFLTANGLTPPDAWEGVDNVVKKNQAVYSSSPDRGLYQLLQLMPKIREQVPDFELVICYGFHNWESAIKARNNEVDKILVSKIKGLMDQPGVKYLGRIPKRELAVHQMESKIWLFPSWFAETFCIGSVENAFAKNAILSTDFAGLKTTIGDAGILLNPQGLSRDNLYPESYVSKFVEEAVNLLKNEDYRRVWADKAYKKVQRYTWEKIADDWIAKFNK